MNSVNLIETHRQLQEEVAQAYKSKTLIKGFYQTLKAISLYHTNPVVKLVIGGALDPNFEQVLTGALKRANIDLTLEHSKDKMLVSAVIRTIEEQEGKKPRKPFCCKLFCITKNPQ